MNLTQTKINDLLTKRIDAWDTIDRAYDQGLFVKALNLTKYVEEVLTPQIREEYGL